MYKFHLIPNIYSVTINFLQSFKKFIASNDNIFILQKYIDNVNEIELIMGKVSDIKLQHQSDYQNC
ncbi:hypothetical protein NIES4101_70330 [Calothrix sp. NIES-4101]|nr:hypothetical protein NIES4101_70330 [Calothrix sp. NIES-4101]